MNRLLLEEGTGKVDMSEPRGQGKLQVQSRGWELRVLLSGGPGEGWHSALDALFSIWDSPSHTCSSQAGVL